MTTLLELCRRAVYILGYSFLYVNPKLGVPTIAPRKEEACSKIYSAEENLSISRKNSGLTCSHSTSEYRIASFLKAAPDLLGKLRAFVGSVGADHSVKLLQCLNTLLQACYCPTNTCNSVPRNKSTIQKHPQKNEPFGCATSVGQIPASHLQNETLSSPQWPILVKHVHKLPLSQNSSVSGGFHRS